MVDKQGDKGNFNMPSFRTHIFAITFFSLLIPYGDATSEQVLAIEAARRVESTDGRSVLENWSFVTSDHPGISEVTVPDNPLLEGAKTIYGRFNEKDPKTASLAILNTQNMQKIKLLAKKTSNTEFIHRIDGDPEAEVNILMYEGIIDEKDTTAIIYIWYGNPIDNNENYSAVHAFIAPTAIFKALGGITIPGVLWLSRTSSEADQLIEDSSLSPDAATTKLALFVDNFAVNYIINHLAIMSMMGQLNAANQQLLNSMQSYNTALSQCNGFDCTMSQDAQGTWSID